jgi:septum formation protein
MKLILASESEWRSRLLSWLDIPFVVVISGVDETVLEEDDADELVATLAAMKARAVARIESEKRVFAADDEARVLVLAADTVVVYGGEIIGKPIDREDAKRIISLLAGKTHEVWTGVCLIDADTNQQRVEVEKTLVSFKPMSDKQIEDFLETDEWKGKAGGYQLLKSIDQHVRDIDGSATNVIGLPLLKVEELLEDFGVPVGVDDVRKTISDQIGYTS